MRHGQRSKSRTPACVVVACSWVIFAMIAYSQRASAMPGDLDLGFASAGKFSADIGCTLSAAVLMPVKMVRDAQGSLYLVGFCATGNADSGQGTSEVKVVKLDANGDRITSFGSGGIATINTSNYDTANAAAIDSSGDLYIAGNSELFINAQPTPVFAVWKLDSSSGSLITSFGSGGVKTINVTADNYAYALLLDGSGNIYVAGESVVLDYTFAVAKLDSNGNLVSSFGNGGSETIAVGSNALGNVRALAIDGAGHLYLAGETRPKDGSGNYDFTLAEINDSNGALVSSFGNAGIKTFDLGNNNDDLVNAVILDGGGSLYLAGSTSIAIDAGSSRLIAVVVKVNASSGALVPSFAGGGIKTLDPNGNGSIASDLALDSGGHLYVAGGQVDLTTLSSDLLVVKMDTNGNLAADFGIGGSKLFSITGYDEADTILLDNNGHLYVSGVSENYSDVTPRPERVFIAARLLTANNITTTTLSSSLNPARVGVSVTLNASITSSGATPTGNVTFNDGNTVICASVSVVNSHASCSTSTLAGTIAAHAISAIYSGDANNLGSVSSVLEQRILGDGVFKSGFE